MASPLKKLFETRLEVADQILVSCFMPPLRNPPIAGDAKFHPLTVKLATCPGRGLTKFHPEVVVFLMTGQHAIFRHGNISHSGHFSRRIFPQLFLLGSLRVRLLFPTVVKALSVRPEIQSLCLTLTRLRTKISEV